MDRRNFLKTTGSLVSATAFSGGAIRYRIYSQFGLGVIAVAKICFLTGLTFWLGNLAVLGSGMAYRPDAPARILQLPPGTVRIIGIAVTMLGVILVAGGEKAPDQNDAEAVRRSGKGIVWAFCAAVGFGVLFWLLGIRTVPRTGPFAAVWLIRLTGFTITLAILYFGKYPIRKPLGSVTWQLAGMGVMDTSAFVLNNRGLQLEQISIVSVLASLYGAVTVALAAIFLREHVSKWQWAGIIAIFTGIYLISK